MAGHPGTPLKPDFFDRDPQAVAGDLIGKVVTHRVKNLPAHSPPASLWVAAQIIETEAYYLWDKASHASLGFTEKRRALFMEPGTLYLYYARGGDSLNFSCAGEGNAVLVKAGIPWLGKDAPEDAEEKAPEDEARLAWMRKHNPLPGGRTRPDARLCAGQTLLCRSLGLKVPHWDTRLLGASPDFQLLDVGYQPEQLARTTRLGIPPGRDGHLPFRFVDVAHAAHCTRNPLKGKAVEGRDYHLFSPPAQVWL